MQWPCALMGGGGRLLPCTILGCECNATSLHICSSENILAKLTLGKLTLGKLALGRLTLGKLTCIQFKNAKTTSRKKTTNPLKVIGISHLQENSFFVRAVNSFNFLYRHSIIDFNEPTNKSNVKVYLVASQTDDKWV